MKQHILEHWIKLAQEIQNGVAQQARVEYNQKGETQLWKDLVQSNQISSKLCIELQSILYDLNT